MQRITLADQVYTIVEERVKNREIQPGQYLNVATLAQELNVSQTPVREALNRLAKAGLVKSVPYVGFVACKVSRHEVIEIYQLRVLLEGFAASQAAEKASTEAIAHIESVLTELDTEASQHGSTTKRRDLEHEFHLSIARAAGNETLTELLQILLARTWLFWQDWQGPRPLVPGGHSGRYPKLILEALKAGDSQAAERVMREHLEAPLTRLLNLATEGPEAEAKGMPEEVTIRQRTT